MEEKANKKSLKATTARVVGVLLIAVAVIFMTWFLLNGEKTVTGGYPGTEKNITLSCSKQNETYPVLKEAEKTDTKDVRIDAIYNGRELNTISLMYMMYYGTGEAIETAEARTHVAMNESFSDDELAPDSFSATFNRLPNGVKLTLYANRSDLSEKAAKYFLLDFDKKNPLTLDSMKKHYEENDFVCSTNEK